MLGWLLLQSNHDGHDGMVCSRVGANGLEMSGRRSRDMKEMQRHRIVLGGQLNEY